MLYYSKNQSRSVEDSFKNLNFDWKGGNNSHTPGIWISPKPFFVGDIPVLLMDTQGVYGSNTDDVTSAKVFALRYFDTTVANHQYFPLKIWTFP
jgi:hypothetical protein